MERLYRFTIPGISFVVSAWAFTYSLSGKNIFDDVSRNPPFLLEILPVLLSLPILGLTITSFLHAIFHTISWNGLPGPYWLYMPGEIDPRLYTEFSISKARPASMSEWRNFYWRYQAFLRETLKTETIEFLTRRWTYCFIHYNSIFSIGLALLASLLYVCFAIDVVCFKPCIFAALLVVFVLYVISALRLTYFARGDATNIEQQCVLNHLA